MANFTTHIAVGTIVSGALATLTLAADVVAPENLVAVTLAGVLGSVLPDIDLKDSRPSRAMFAGLAIFFSFAVLFNAATKYSIAELWILWLGTLLTVRYGLHTVFHRISVHRGIWHSILAAVFSSVATAIVFQHMLGKPPASLGWPRRSCLCGYLTHLTLDEIYSVDVMDTRLKSSFGTALKFFDRRHFYASLAMAAATVGGDHDLAADRHVRRRAFVAQPVERPGAAAAAERQMVRPRRYAAFREPQRRCDDRR